MPVGIIFLHRQMECDLVPCLNYDATAVEYVQEEFLS